MIKILSLLVIAFLFAAPQKVEAQETYEYHKWIRTIYKYDVQILCIDNTGYLVIGNKNTIQMKELSPESVALRCKKRK